jgi:glycosyltransferase involved in cell wall biosynthesis
MRATQNVKLAYLCSEYPAISHTFVLREVNALRRLGAEIATFSIRRTPTQKLLSQDDRTAAESTFAILPPQWTGLLVAHFELALKAPSTYLSTLLLALRTAPSGLRGRLWQCFYFAEAVVLWHACRARGIRHIHVHLANAAADLALLASRIGSACEPTRPWSWSLTMHGPTEFADVRHYRLAQKLREASFAVCISDYARSQLMTLSDPSIWERLEVVHVGIPLEQFTRTERSPAVSAAPRILCLGRLVPEKGQAVLLEAVGLLAARGRRVAVAFAGEGPSRPALEALAGKLGVQAQTTFLGAVGQEEIHDLYARSSIFCLPSFAEGVPCVLMEAMAMELPVLSTRIAGIPELIEDGESGLLVAPGRADELATALERLLEDPELVRRLTRQGREKVVREFDSQRTAEQLHELFVRRLSQAPAVMNGGGVASIETLPREALSRSS